MFSDYGYSEDKNLGKPYDIKLLKRLWPFIRPYRISLLSAVFLVVIITFLDLAMPYVTKVAIDQYIVPASWESISDSTGEKARILKLDISLPEINAIISAYPEYFQIQGNTALISMKNAGKLKKSDIAVLRKDDIQGITFIAGIFLFIIILDFILNFIHVMLMEYAGQGVMHDLRMKLFAHIQSLPVSFFNKNPIARLVTRNTNDIQNMHELFTSVIVFLFKDLFLFIGIALLLVGIRWQLALICFTVLPFVLYVSLYFSRQAREIFRTLRVKTSEINIRFSETIAGIKVIQLFRQEAENYQKFSILNHEFYQAGMEQIRIFAVFMPLIELLSATALALVIYFGGGSVISDHISLGVLVAFISYMRMFFRPIRDIAEKYNILQNAMSSAERIFLLLDNSEQSMSSEQLSVNRGVFIDRIEKLEFNDVVFGYLKDETVLKGISFKVYAGETIAIVGPTGSGKTSLINLIIRFYDPLSGCIRINGRDIREIDIFSLRSKIALVTQDPFLFSESIRKNIMRGTRHISEQALSDIIEASNCREIIERLPQGPDTKLSEGGASVSSGERQLISIARAFARDPALIILDEATSYIDSETEVKIQKAMANLMEKRTSIIIAHRLSTARNADTVIVLNRGQIIESGSHDELMKRKGFYFKLNQLQDHRTHIPHTFNEKKY